MIAGVTVTLGATHCWPDAPDARIYLRSPHPHTFVIRAEVDERESREIEFHDLFAKVDSVVRGKAIINVNEDCLPDLGTQSCEDLAQLVLAYVPEAVSVQVSEDGWNYARVNRRQLPPIVCICGSTRFREAWESAIASLERQGKIVLAVGSFPNAAGIELPVEEKLRYDVLHRRKIDMADEILVLNVGGYIGESTRGEISYAIQRGKPINWLENTPDAAGS